MSTTMAAPETWTTTRLGWLFQPVSDRGHQDAMVLSVYRDHGVILKDSRTDNFNRTPENLSNYQLVQHGDLVVNRMKAWQGSLGISKHQGIVSPDYEVLRPTNLEHDRRFLHSLLRSRALIDQYALRSTGIRPCQWRLYWDEMKTIEISLPSAEEQCAIADYLDRETARIDTLIEEQQRLIEMLRERRASEIAAEFAEAAMTPLRQVIEYAQTGPFGTQLTADEYVDSGVPVINPTHIRRGLIVPDDSTTVTPEKADDLARYRLAVGDIVLGRKGEVDKSALVDRRSASYVCGSDADGLAPELRDGAGLSVVVSPVGRGPQST